jgi:glutamine synthetase adenylyltransferase
MSTVAEIKAALPNLANEELRQVEETLRQLYRERKAGIIFDDAYGLWTEADQTSAAAEVFQMLDHEETDHGSTGAR